MIRISKHTTKFSNRNKKLKLNDFVDQYQLIVQYFVNYLWTNTITYKNKTFSIKDNLLECPNMLSTKDHKFNLSQRAVKCAATQACGIVSAVTEKKRKLLYIYNKN